VIDWLLKNDLMGQVNWYQIQSGDSDQYPGEIIERDLSSGKIDLAVVWGPIAGYVAHNTHAAPIVAVPLVSRPGMKVDFEIAMGVRQGDKAFRERIDQLIVANQARIDAILAQYGVPLLDQQGRAVRVPQQTGSP
jgi:mxaJ protein